MNYYPSMFSLWEKLVRRLHPEGIPFPGSIIHNAIRIISIFRRHCRLISDDILGHAKRGRLPGIVKGPPPHLLREAIREFGRLRMLMLRLHTFEEPFYTRKEFEQMAASTHFEKVETGYVGVPYRLLLKKERR